MLKTLEIDYVGSKLSFNDQTEINLNDLIGMLPCIYKIFEVGPFRLNEIDVRNSTF